MTHPFLKNGYIYIIEKDFDESYEIYIERAWLIINTFNDINNNENKKKYTLDELITLSRIWRNIKYLNCSYSDLINDKITNCFEHISN